MEFGGSDTNGMVHLDFRNITNGSMYTEDDYQFPSHIQQLENLPLANFIFYCSFITLALNGFVLLIAVKYVNYNVRLEQLYVINLTVSDLIFGMVFMTTAKIHLTLPTWFCRPFYVLVWSSRIASVMFLLLLNLHKLVTLFFPIHSLIFVSKHRVVTQVVVSWVIIFCAAILFATNALTLKPMDFTVTCAVILDPTYYVCMVMIFYVLPLTGSLVISFFIFVLAQKKVHRSTDILKERKKFCKRVLFVFTSTLWTALTSLPYRVTAMKVQICRSIANQFWSNNVADVSISANATYLNSDEYNLIYSFLNASGIITAPLEYHQQSLLDDNYLTVSSPQPPYIPPYDSCVIDVATLVNLFHILLIIGAVFNPLITIATQTKYRKGAYMVWKSILHRRTTGYAVTNLTRVQAKKNATDITCSSF